MTAVEWLMEELPKHGSGAVRTFGDLFEQAKEIEKEQAELYAKFAVLNDRSGNPVIPFNEFINIDSL
jgi:hypothetical protein